MLFDVSMYRSIAVDGVRDDEASMEESALLWEIEDFGKLRESRIEQGHNDMVVSVYYREWACVLRSTSRAKG